MGTLTGTSIINKAATLLFDTNNIKWSRTELLGYLNDGQRAAFSIDPTTNNTVTSMVMVAGPRQTIPAGSWALMDVYENMGIAPGTTPGRAVRLTSKKLLDSFNPNWRTDPAVTAVQNFMFDERDQTAFWVYPPSDGTGFIRINHALPPTNLAAEANTLVLNDAYEPALLDYILYRAGEKQASFAEGDQQTTNHLAKFADQVKALSKSLDDVNPNSMFSPLAMGVPEAPVT